MRQGIIVDGQVVNIPGVYPHVDVSAMTPPVLGADGVLGVIAPSDGGLPGVVYSFSSYDDAAKVLRGGRILSYLARMFNPSQHEDVRGASNIRFIRSNPSATPSGVSVPSTNAHPVAVSARDAGAWTNGMRITITISDVASAFVVDRSGSPVSYFPKKVLVENIPDNRGYSYTLLNGINLTAPTGSTMTVDSAAQSVTLATNSTLVEEIHFPMVPTLADLAAWINNHTGWAASVVGPSYLPTAALSDNTSAPAAVANLAVFFPAESGALWYLLSTQCPVVTAAEPVVKDSLPAMTQTYFTGGLGKGTDELGTNDLAAALTLASTTRMDLVWMMSTDPALQALLLNHCIAMSTDVARKYRVGITGVNFDATSPFNGAVSGASDNDDAIAKAAATVASLDGPMVFCLNGTTTANPVTGVQEMLGGLGLAAQVAGMKSGTPAGTPLTNKTLNSTGLELSALTDAQKTLILNSGILTAFYDADEGTTKILQAITTMQSTNPMLRNFGGLYITHQIARMEIRVLSKFIGTDLDLPTGNLIKMAMAKALDGAIRTGDNPAGYLTQGRLADGTVIPAWEKLSVSGDSTTGTWAIKVEPHPIGETDFITVENKLTPAPIEL